MKQDRRSTNERSVTDLLLQKPLGWKPGIADCQRLPVLPHGAGFSPYRIYASPHTWGSTFSPARHVIATSHNISVGISCTAMPVNQQGQCNPRRTLICSLKEDSLLFMILQCTHRTKHIPHMTLALLWPAVAVLAASFLHCCWAWWLRYCLTVVAAARWLCLCAPTPSLLLNVETNFL